ncbi:MAG: hypothetical protein ABI861_03275 [Panacibacter sp.]
MKKTIYLLLFQLLACFLFTPQGMAQELPKAPPTTPMNAGFDVIILKNGDIVYGLVKEVGLELIKYQRTDIPDGPIYTIPRKDVYAISYRNQVKDILNPKTWLLPVITDTIPSETLMRDTIVQLPVVQKKELLSNGSFLAGIGFMRGFTKVENANDYSSSTSFPTLSFAYEIVRKNNIRVGLQLAVGSRKFTRQEFSAYDSAINDIKLKENIITLHLYGKYNLGNSTGFFQPYLVGGLGIQSSYVKSEYTLRFVNNANQSIYVSSGGRSVGLGVLLRAGGEYRISDEWRAFADAGIGPAILQIGIAFNVD